MLFNNNASQSSKVIRADLAHWQADQMGTRHHFNGTHSTSSIDEITCSFRRMRNYVR